eukprot:CAMPEP_0171458856 /NCGR_PEP_ID=MMETSP0945-20130129/4371_1 /TAXON_ID=109269 /ORGANISM="Vaucheria litorea, Strain CCMP2940" /LENGTH=202 /DNA_ID=CAMNT_0011984755 /DNA_START=121 /DNA_END=725 /DNA_ORIENTATION=+
MSNDNQEDVPVLDMDTLKKKVNLCEHPVVAHKMTQLRRKETSSKHFRELMTEMTEYLGYRATADLETKPLEVETPVATFSGCEIATKVALVPIMRSGLGMVDAMLDVLPNAPVYHIGMYRNKESLVPVLYYNKLPAVCNVERTIVLEPMIATAGTIIATCDILEEWGAKEIHVEWSQSLHPARALANFLHRTLMSRFTLLPS